MDYEGWRKKQTPELVAYLKAGLLDSDDEDENPLKYLKDLKSSEEVGGTYFGFERNRTFGFELIFVP